MKLNEHVFEQFPVTSLPITPDDLVDRQFFFRSANSVYLSRKNDIRPIDPSGRPSVPRPSMRYRRQFYARIQPTVSPISHSRRGQGLLDRAARSDCRAIKTGYLGEVSVCSFGAFAGDRVSLKESKGRTSRNEMIPYRKLIDFFMIDGQQID